MDCAHSYRLTDHYNTGASSVTEKHSSIFLVINNSDGFNIDFIEYFAVSVLSFKYFLG